MMRHGLRPRAGGRLPERAPAQGSGQLRFCLPAAASCEVHLRPEAADRFALPCTCRCRTGLSVGPGILRGVDDDLDPRELAEVGRRLARSQYRKASRDLRRLADDADAAEIAERLIDLIVAHRDVTFEYGSDRHERACEAWELLNGSADSYESWSDEKRSQYHSEVRELAKSLPKWPHEQTIEADQHARMIELRLGEVNLGRLVRERHPALVLYWLGPRPRRSIFEEPGTLPPDERQDGSEVIDRWLGGEDVPEDEMQAFATASSERAQNIGYDFMRQTYDIPRTVYDRYAGATAALVLGAGLDGLTYNEEGNFKLKPKKADLHLDMAVEIYAEKVADAVSLAPGSLSRFYEVICLDRRGVPQLGDGSGRRL